MIFHLCRYGWNHPWIILINRMPNFFILRAIKQINDVEMVILHASPLESLLKTSLGLPSAVPGRLVKQHFTFFHFSCEKRGNLSPFGASENSRSIPACHAAGSMQPSMVLDRTMFNLYCSTTWLDQAQRKTPWTARVRVRQRQREESVERKQHGEAQAEGSRRAALHSTHAKRCWIQEVILYATTAGTPWSTIGVSVQEQSPGEFRDRTNMIENTTKGLQTAPSSKDVQLPPHTECPIYTALY